MQRFIVTRLAYSVLVLFAVSVIVFALARTTGDPTDTLVPLDASVEQREALRKIWGLDKSYPEQYLTFLGNAFKGKFGDSLKWSDSTAMGMVLQRFPNTLMLAGVAIGISLIIAVPIGVLSAVRKDTPFDIMGKVFALLGQATPPFWLGIMLIWGFAVKVDWFPTGGKGGLNTLILPAITLGWFQVAALMRLVRSAMLEVLDSEYVKLARIKGIAEWRVVWKHCLRNAAIPPLTLFGILAANVMTGAIVTETVFSWPGTGLLAVDAIRARDYPVVQAVVILFACIYIGMNLLVDILYAYLNPRIRYGRG
jgi:peptide/nickel transport system permease protein